MWPLPGSNISANISSDGSFTVAGSSRLPVYPPVAYCNTDPAESWLVSRFERSALVPYNLPILLFSRKFYWMGPASAALYFLFILVAPKLMEKRKAFDLKTPLKYWNLFLAVFSFIGTVRTWTHIGQMWWRMGFTQYLCSPVIYSTGHTTACFWLTLFVYSKYFELVDTAFIILRKRNLGFLHWYHHLTVLLYTWDAYTHEQPAGMFFAAINYFVHAIMYFYYYLAAVQPKPPKWSIFVTVLQISQMILGIALTLWTVHLSFVYRFLPKWTSLQGHQPLTSSACYVVRSNLLGGCLMYATYFYLFMEFFVKRYILKSKSAGGAVAAKVERVDKSFQSDLRKSTTDHGEKKNI